MPCTDSEKADTRVVFFVTDSEKGISRRKFELQSLLVKCQFMLSTMSSRERPRPRDPAKVILLEPGRRVFVIDQDQASGWWDLHQCRVVSFADIAPMQWWLRFPDWADWHLCYKEEDMYLNAKSALAALNSKINNQPAKFQSDDDHDDDDDDDLPELVPYSSQDNWCYSIERRQSECVLNDRRHKPRALALETEFELQLGPAWRLLYARQVPILLASYFQFLLLFEKAHPIYADQWSRMYQWSRSYYNSSCVT